MRLASAAIWFLIDCIFPFRQPLSEEEKRANEERRSAAQIEWNHRLANLTTDEETLSKYVDACKDALDDERERQRGVDSRLTTMIGLSSITATIALGTILTASVQKPQWTWVLMALLLYLTLQTCSTVLAAISGLDRRAYRGSLPFDVLPKQGEDRVAHLRRLMQLHHDILMQHQDQNNSKVTQMAVAYRAGRNFILGVIVFAGVAASYRLL